MAAFFTGPTKLGRRPTTSTALIKRASLLRYLEPVSNVEFLTFNNESKVPVIVNKVFDYIFNSNIFNSFFLSFRLRQSTSPPLSQMETCWVMTCTAAL